MARIPEEWKLSPSQHLEIFNNEIAPREILPHVQHQNSSPDPSTLNNDNDNNKKRPPLAIIIVGQTGAGKTRLAPDLLHAMSTIFNLASSTSSSSCTNNNNDNPKEEAQTPPNSLPTATAKSVPLMEGKGEGGVVGKGKEKEKGKGIAHLIADTYKTYHPHYQTALSSSSSTPSLASTLTSSAAREWLAMACTLCSEYQIPVLLESACRHPDDFIQLASIFHEKGYTVLVAILAVPAALSRLGILVRYYTDLPEARSRGLPLRLTPRRVHDDSFEGLEEAARWVDGHGNGNGKNTERAVDGVVVVRRGGKVAYKNTRTSPKPNLTGKRGGEEGNEGECRKWEKEPPGAMEALTRERKRELSVEERDNARRDIAALKLLQDPKVDDEIRQIEELLDGLLGKKEQQTTLQELDEMFDAGRFVREYYLDLD